MKRFAECGKRSNGAEGTVPLLTGKTALVIALCMRVAETAGEIAVPAKVWQPEGAALPPDTTAECQYSLESGMTGIEPKSMNPLRYPAENPRGVHPESSNNDAGILIIQHGFTAGLYFSWSPERKLRALFL